MPGPLTSSKANMPQSNKRHVLIYLIFFIILDLCHRVKLEADTQPAPKKRKLESPSFGSQGSQSQSSFVDVLERLKEESGEKPEAEGGANCWSRPPLPPINEKKDTIVFQQIDVENCSEGQRPLLRIYGVTEAGHSVLAHIHDFLPYFYVAQPRGFQEDDLDAFRQYLNSQTVDGAVKYVEIVKKRTLWGYRGDATVPFIKITLTNPQYVPKVRDKFSAPMTSSGDVLTLRLFTSLRAQRMSLQGCLCSISRRPVSNLRKQHRVYSEIHD
uniref:Putative delta DNA polymerase n=1 Tax=Moniliophthora roreri TaxID=221103 RepID=A0A0W0FX77_MONRR